MDKQKGWKIFPFYRTLSPIGAAAKNNYAINMLSQTTLICLNTIYPICDHDPNSPKMAKNMPETTSYTLSTSGMLLYHRTSRP